MNAEDLGGPFATVFDVGAFRGDFAMMCRQAWPECRVLAFEPLEIPMLMDDRIIWHRFALGPQVGKATMHRCEFVPSSSFLPMAQLHKDAFPYTRGSTDVEVQVDVLDAYAVVAEAPCLLKIDVQGYELEVLRGGPKVLAQCAAVLLEVSHEELYEGVPTPGALGEFMHAHGFTFQATVDRLYHPKRRKTLLQSDQLWTRA